ncbi:MAG: hypothetical protein J6N19_17770, partial [Clostridium sp.]|nr:hypothetical protein [Clostridium sp.]
MQFHDLQAMVRERFADMVNKYKVAYQTDVDPDVLWNTYLESFPEEKNPIFRVRREHDCSCCRHFIKRIGGIVFIDEEQKLHTIWGFAVPDDGYQVVLDAVDALVKSSKITQEFITTESSFGTEESREYDQDYKLVTTWKHFYLEVPKEWRYRGRDTIDSERSRRRSAAEVFGRALREITMDSIDTVLELIRSNTLYKGAEWEKQITDLRKMKTDYEKIPEEQRELYVWRIAPSVGPVMSRIRNHSIGTLLTDISEGMDLNEAVRRYEAIVAPANYKRPKAIFTKKMLEEAQKTVQELGYMDSLRRRYAKLDDITVNNILFSNRDASKRIKGGNVFDDMMSEAKSSPKKFDRVQEIGIEQFISDVLPDAVSVEAYVENKHEKNMCSLITSSDPFAPSMFKWDNPFSWAYSGNIADSDIKQNVKNAGGNVIADLRFSIQWNDGRIPHSQNDLDAHCIEPNGHEIFFGDKRSARTGGFLDVDIIHPVLGVPAVENIAYATKSRMIPGEYKFYVHQYSNRGGRDGFRAEIEMDGQIFRYDYDKELRQGEEVKVATVTLGADGKFAIKEHLPSTTSSREIWGVKSMEFVPVTVIMYSPNYWDEQKGIGNKHYMFMLKGCVNPEQPNGFYNEFL